MTKNDQAGQQGGPRFGETKSKSLYCAQQTRSLDGKPEHDGRSLVTTSHEVVRDRAKRRNATPATVSGTEHGDHPGVLRLDFDGNSQNLRHVDWEYWLATFDARELHFLFHENRSDGTRSSFFRIENLHSEDA